mmetsp:Transcript_124851/g.353379  ORF Transcript_124851/g.353379 Transcript_124851/m.353379 type:complete len:428 (-) Transcript_124851:143-1426(-)
MLSMLKLTPWDRVTRSQGVGSLRRRTCDRRLHPPLAQQVDGRHRGSSCGGRRRRRGPGRQRLEDAGVEPPRGAVRGSRPTPALVLGLRRADVHDLDLAVLAEVHQEILGGVVLRGLHCPRHPGPLARGEPAHGVVLQGRGCARLVQPDVSAPGRDHLRHLPARRRYVGDLPRRRPAVVRWPLLAVNPRDLDDGAQWPAPGAVDQHAAGLRVAAPPRHVAKQGDRVLPGVQQAAVLPGMPRLVLEVLEDALWDTSVDVDLYEIVLQTEPHGLRPQWAVPDRVERLTGLVDRDGQRLDQRPRSFQAHAVVGKVELVHRVVHEKFSHPACAHVTNPVIVEFQREDGNLQVLKELDHCHAPVVSNQVLTYVKAQTDGLPEDKLLEVCLGPDTPGCKSVVLKAPATEVDACSSVASLLDHLSSQLLELGVAV